MTFIQMTIPNFWWCHCWTIPKYWSQHLPRMHFHNWCPGILLDQSYTACAALHLLPTNISHDEFAHQLVVNYLMAQRSSDFEVKESIVSSPLRFYIHIIRQPHRSSKWIEASFHSSLWNRSCPLQNVCSSKGNQWSTCIDSFRQAKYQNQHFIFWHIENQQPNDIELQQWQTNPCNTSWHRHCKILCAHYITLHSTAIVYLSSSRILDNR